MEVNTTFTSRRKMFVKDNMLKHKVVFIYFAPFIINELRSINELKQ